MSETNYEQNLEARANLFKALGHPMRLLIVNLIKIKPRHGQELAEILRLNPATISHHLKVLRDAGLLTSRRKGLWSFYEADPAGLTSLAELPSLIGG